MTRFCPYYPRPAKSRLSPWRMFFGKQRSWLDGLYERSYAMKMGEVHLPGVDLYMVNEPPLVRQVMVGEAADFPKHQWLGDSLRPLLGDSIFTTNGETWQRQRALMNPAFEQARLQVAFPVMREAVQDLQQRLDAQADGATPRDVEIEMTHVTADIILRTIFSLSLTGPDAKRVFDAFERFQTLAPRLLMPQLFRLGWLVPFWSRRRSRQAAREIRALLESFIRPRWEARAEAAKEPPRDILGALLQARTETDAEGFGFDELVDQVAMLFLAGHETSASALTWALHLLARDPEIQQRVCDEVCAVCGDAPIDYAHVKDLEFTRNVFREVLRLFPPVGFMARECAAPKTMRDKAVAAGASVVVAPWLIHRHRELWERPDEFDPDRFAEPAGRESARSAYLPFGLGPRVCIGAAFALQEAVLILASVARRYRLERVPGRDPVPVGRLTIRSANGVFLKIEKRGLR